MNSSRQRAVFYVTTALLVAAAILAVVLPRGRGGGGNGASATPTTNSASAPARSSGSSSPAAGARAQHRTHWRARRLPDQQPRAVHWQTAALATARTFVTWFDRWLAGETNARQAPDVTPGYAAKLRVTVNNVPPAAQGRIAAIVHLIPAGMPPNVTDPSEAWIYTATRSQRALIQFTVEERLYGRRWLVYNLYQGP